MNPARSLGRATVAGDWALLRVYFIGPPLGAVAAAVAFSVRRCGRKKRNATTSDST